MTSLRTSCGASGEPAAKLRRRPRDQIQPQDATKNFKDFDRWLNIRMIHNSTKANLRER